MTQGDSEVRKVVATEAALELIERLRSKHGRSCSINRGDAATEVPRCAFH